MNESCCCPPDVADHAGDLPVQAGGSLPRLAPLCPACGEKGRAVPGQTVKALLSTSLRAVRDVQYFFCATPACPVVYFTPDDQQTFTIDQVRERVYQKEPAAEGVLICYCFRHTVDDFRAASPEDRGALVDDINAGIKAGQCACDLRNPQGSCCLGNVTKLLKRLGQQSPLE